jgi:hypothetical protein
MRVKPYWWIKAVIMVLALVGVLWMIQSLREGPPSALELPTVPAKVHFHPAPPTPPPPK